MTKLRKFLMIGAGVAAVAAVVAGPALAHALKYHEMDVRGPDGEVAHIRYTGNTPPQVRFDAQPVADNFGGFFYMRPFAEMERVSAALDRQAAEMMQEINSPVFFSVPSPQAIQARLGAMPRGAEGYSMMTISENGKTCTERMSYDYTGNGKPQVQKASYGDCGTGSLKSDVPAKVQVKSPLTHSLEHGVKVIEAAL